MQFHWLSDNKIKKYAETKTIYFIIRDGVLIKEIYKVSTHKIMPFLTAKDTGEKSIHGHKGFSLLDIKEKFDSKKIYG